MEKMLVPAGLVHLSVTAIPSMVHQEIAVSTKDAPIVIAKVQMVLAMTGEAMVLNVLASPADLAYVKRVWDLYMAPEPTYTGPFIPGVN